jgi:hypothetical protein
MSVGLPAQESTQPSPTGCPATSYLFRRQKILFEKIESLSGGKVHNDRNRFGTPDLIVSLIFFGNLREDVLGFLLQRHVQLLSLS